MTFTASQKIAMSKFVLQLDCNSVGFTVTYTHIVSMPAGKKKELNFDQPDTQDNNYLRKM